MKSVIIEEAELLCQAGDTPAAVLEALQSGTRPAMQTATVGGTPVPVAAVCTPLQLPTEPGYATRTNALLLHCLGKLSASYTKVAPQRLGVVVGSSNAGIEEFHAAYTQGTTGLQDWQKLEPGNVAAFIAQHTGAKGPAYTISTACSSAGKALAAAAGLLQAGICDAVIAGGGDALCRFALEGFHALQLIADKPCEPFSLCGGGINHGEGAALFLLTYREAHTGDIVLSGYGETADAHHTTTPEPGGLQAARAMQQALQMAKLQAADIDYINMHGTGTDANDSMEMNALTRVFGTACPPCSSTKTYTGHCLGAAGAIEAAICYALLKANTCTLPQAAPAALPPGYEHINFSAIAKRPLSHCLSNSFAFGGNNVSLILSRHA